MGQGEELLKKSKVNRILVLDKTTYIVFRLTNEVFKDCTIYEIVTHLPVDIASVLQRTSQPMLCTEDEHGSLIYNSDILDQMYDNYLANNFILIVK